MILVTSGDRMTPIQKNANRKLRFFAAFPGSDRERIIPGSAMRTVLEAPKIKKETRNRELKPETRVRHREDENNKIVEAVVIARALRINMPSRIKPAKLPIKW